MLAGLCSVCLMWRERARETLTIARTDRTRLACTAGWGLGRGTGGGGEEGPGCAYPAPARISAMADHHRAHDPNLARWGALRHPPCKTRTRPVKKCDALEEYLLTPSNRIWVRFLSLPHPRFWGHAERFFLAPFGPRGAHTTARPPARTYWTPKTHPNSSMGHPKVPLGRSNFFSSIAIFFTCTPN